MSGLVYSNTTQGTKWNPASNGAYPFVTVLDIDLTAQPSQTLSPDGVFTIAGVSFTKQRSADDAVALALVNGTGIRFQPINGSATGGTPPLAMPTIATSLAALAPAITASSQVRVWSKWADDPATINSFQDCGINSELGGFPLTNVGGGYLCMALRAFDSSNGHGAGAGEAYGIFTFGGTRTVVNETSLPLAGGLTAANRVLVYESFPLLGVQARVLVGPDTNPWPDVPQLTLATAVVSTLAGNYQNMRGLDLWAFWAAEAGLGVNLNTVLKAIRIDVAF